MNGFKAALYTELIKHKRTFALWILAAFPLFTVGIICLSVYHMKIEDASPWIRYAFSLQNTLSFFLPFFLVMLIAYSVHLEHKSNTWKHLLCMPLNRSTVYFAKLSMILLLVLVSWLLMLLVAYAGVFLLHQINPLKFHFLEGGVPLLKFSLSLLKPYIAALFIISLQYWLSTRLRNLVLPIIIGIGMIILPIAILIVMGMSGMIQHAKSMEVVFSYDPYAYPFARIFSFMKGPEQSVSLFPRLTIIYGILAILVSYSGSLEFRKRNF
ncbi:MAG TPA: ABC transporter permease [Bacteroidales bacterium]|nr:ABC transporter permease [Bacteroidales bacterium]HSA44204.1 ABC transporter permease [Bacteroidales bacterium]